MLVRVGADVAGDALVVWEAEAGPIAQDPIAALAMGRGRVSHGRDLHIPPHTCSYADWAPPETSRIFQVTCCPELPLKGLQA